MKTFVCCLCLVTLSLAADVQVEYFTSVNLECDNNDLNLTYSNQFNVVKKYWILPSGDVINADSTPPIVKAKPQWTLSTDFSRFNLTLNRVDDADFGVYRCIVVYNNNSIAVVSQGLNIDGPYYGHLAERYRKNAIVGGIAAGVLFVVIGGSCLIWQLRYSQRKNKKEGLETDFDNVSNGKVNQGADFQETEKL